MKGEKMNNKKQNIKREMKETFNKVAKSFGEVGPKYWNEFGNRLVKLANIKEGAEVLDVGMGKGASLFPAIKKVGEDGKVIGIDISENMVKETYKEISTKSIENAKVLVMDVDKLEFNNQSFDNIIGAFLL
ncbi:MAG: methyltransferase domain-containing protein [Firmicutes bacterium]|nr:methyltransferase domain-containing protein [Bacillota bacterium]